MILRSWSFFDSIRKGLNHRAFPRKINGLGGLWWLEYGGHMDVIKNNEDIALELRKLVYGIWDYIKNSGEFDDVDNLILDYVCPIPGKRESRRFIGESHVVSERSYSKDTFRRCGIRRRLVYGSACR